jgi:periplasmic copper chaperone A
LGKRSEFPRACLLAIVLTLVACAAMAQAPAGTDSHAFARVPALVVQDAWTRQPPGTDVAAVYLTVRNPTSKPITIVGIESSVAGHAMIHETKTEGGQSRMRPHEQLVVAPGETVKFEPGGLHVMLHDMKQPVAVGQSIQLVLVLADGSRIPVSAVVRPLTAQ